MKGRQRAKRANVLSFVALLSRYPEPRLSFGFGIWRAAEIVKYESSESSGGPYQA